MKQLLLLSIVLTTTLFSVAQTSIKTQKEYGGSSDNSFVRMCIAKNGDLLFGGSSNSNASGTKTANSKGDYDVWIVRTDKTGTKKWDKTIGGSQSDEINDLKTTSDSGFIVVGSSFSNISGDKTENSRGLQDYWIIKLNKSGVIQWNKTFGGSSNDIPGSVEQTADGGYIIAGWSLSPASGDKTDANKGGADVWLVKISASGAMQWNKTIGGSGDDGTISSSSTYTGDNIHPVNCKQTSDGGYLIAASSASNISGDKTANSRGGSDYWLIKTDNTGNVVWDKTIGGSGNDYLNALELTSDGGYIIGGYSVSSISAEKTANSKGGFDYWVVKLNSAGSIQWDKTIGGGSYDVLSSLQQTSDGGYLLGGYSSSGKSGDKSTASRGYQDYWIVKINGLGTVEWNKTVGGNYVETWVDAKETAPNTFWVGGWSYSDVSGDKILPLIGSSDYWLVKLVDNNIGAAAPLIAESKSISNTDVTTAKTFLAYPNPATNILHIQAAGKTTVMLTDQSGKKVLTKTVDGNADLNIAHLPSGTYYLTNSTTGAVQKIVIIK